MKKTLKVGGARVQRGQKRRLEIGVARLPTGTPLSLPVTVLRGRQDGPTIWLSAALHGDEINGTEIIRRVIGQLDAKTLVGTVIAVPIVNVYGFIERSRYLPDRRDLNRSFPGSRIGSLASRLAHLFLSEIVSQCSHGIDFHTGARHRSNLPHLRANLANPEAQRLATAFGAPLLFQAKRIVGSLRAEALRRKIPILVFEAGEPLRFDEPSIRIGVEGTLRVLAELGMIPAGATVPAPRSHEAKQAKWLRAPRSGILQLATSMGEEIAKGDIVARIADPFSGRRRILRAPFDGLIFAQITNPLVYQGDAVLHLARLHEESTRAKKPGKPSKAKKAKKKPRKATKPKARKKAVKKAAKKPAKKKATAASASKGKPPARGGKRSTVRKATRTPRSS